MRPKRYNSMRYLFDRHHFFPLFFKLLFFIASKYSIVGLCLFAAIVAV